MNDMILILSPVFGLFLASVTLKQPHNWINYVKMLILGVCIYFAFSSCNSHEYVRVINKAFTTQEFQELEKKKEYYLSQANYSLKYAKLWIDRETNISVRDLSQFVLTTYCVYQAGGAGTLGAVAVAYSTLSSHGINLFTNWSMISLYLSEAHYNLSMYEYIENCQLMGYIIPFEYYGIDETQP